METGWMKNGVLVVFLAMLAMVVLLAPIAGAGPDAAKKLDGKVLFEQKCLKCHKLAKFKEQENSRKEWVLILSRMQRGTCAMTDDELEAIADYLAKAYGN